MLQFKILSVTSRTIALEIENNECYYTKNRIDVYLNAKKSFETNTNVFVIKNLEPAMEYAICLEDSCTKEISEEVLVTLKNETMVLYVKDFGAKGNGKEVDTLSIQNAIEACPLGGRVLFTEGIYLTAPILLKSNITLELAKGAVLLGVKERERYPILPGLMELDEKDNDFYLSSWEGEVADCFASLITGIQVKDVRIIGEGIIDGNADFDTWWHEAKVKRTAWRPRTIFLNGCKNILIEGITVKNSPSWTIHPLRSENLKFVGLDIQNPKDAPNTDGINPEACRNVMIVGTRFSVGDDCIAIKSGKSSLSRKYTVPSDKIDIRNCLMELGHGAVVIGSEMSGGVKNVSVEKCVFNRTDRGIRIKTRRGRGSTGIIDEIHVSRVRMNKVQTPFTINCFYFCDADGKTEYVWSKEKLPVDDRTPQVGCIYLKDIICKDSEVMAGFFFGLPEQQIACITMEDVDVHFSEDAKAAHAEMLSFSEPVCRRGFYFNNVKQLKLKNIKLENVEGDPFTKLNIDHDNE